MAFFDTFKDTIELVKKTFTVIGKNPAILKPTIKQAWIGAVVYFLVIASIFAIAFPYNILPIIAAIVIFCCIIYLVFIFPFIKIHYKAAQCWMVYRTFAGKSVTYEEGLDRARINKKDIILLGVFDILLRALANKLKQGTRKGGLWLLIDILLKIMGKVVEEGWDLIGHYLLPAAIIKEQTVMEAMPEIKNIRKNVPGALAGVFGFDFVGDLIGKYFALLFFLSAFIGVMIAVALKGIWIPLVILLIISFGLMMLVNVLVGMVKTIYFTLFYMSITMPDKISKQYRSEVTNYLLSNKRRQGTAGRPLGNI
ncbi:MAG: hypothetical protein QME12_02125 [Nanoarchaeota archaeon]|nr:hypothetical protein [Nanoarchaeota archaeon]